MQEKALSIAMQHSRIAILMAVLTLLLLVGATGEAIAHGPCHANPGNVQEFVCSGLPSQDAPRGS